MLIWGWICSFRATCCPWSRHILLFLTSESDSAGQKPLHIHSGIHCENYFDFSSFFATDYYINLCASANGAQVEDARWTFTNLEQWASAQYDLTIISNIRSLCFNIIRAWLKADQAGYTGQDGAPRVFILRPIPSSLRPIPSSIRSILSSIRPIPSSIRPNRPVNDLSPALSNLTVADYFSEWNDEYHPW